MLPCLCPPCVSLDAFLDASLDPWAPPWIFKCFTGCVGASMDLWISGCFHGSLDASVDLWVPPLISNSCRCTLGGRKFRDGRKLGAYQPAQTTAKSIAAELFLGGLLPERNRSESPGANDKQETVRSQTVGDGLKALREQEKVDIQETYNKDKWASRCALLPTHQINRNIPLR